MSKVLLNWAHVIGIEEHRDLKDGYVYVSTIVGKWENDLGDDIESYDNDGRLKQSVNIEVFAAKDITVRGDGSLGVEAWLQQVAKNAEGGEQDD